MRSPYYSLWRLQYRFMFLIVFSLTTPFTRFKLDRSFPVKISKCLHLVIMRCSTKIVVSFPVCSFAMVKRVFHVPKQPNEGVGRLFVEVTASHTTGHTHTHTPGNTPLYEWSARRRGRYLHETQYTHSMIFLALNGILTRDPNNQANADLLLRPHGHRYGLIVLFNCEYSITWMVSFWSQISQL